MAEMMERLEVGNCTMEEVDQLDKLTYNIEGRTICALGEASALPVRGLIKHFRPVIEQRIKQYQAAHPKVNGHH